MISLSLGGILSLNFMLTISSALVLVEQLAWCGLVHNCLCSVGGKCVLHITCSVVRRGMKSWEVSDWAVKLDFTD